MPNTELQICGSLLSILTGPNAEAEFLEFFKGEKGKPFELSKECATFKYMLCQIGDVMFCALDFSSWREDFLTVKPPVGLHAFPEQVKVDGQILQLAELFPFISVIELASSSGSLGIVLCGESFSGIICHAVAAMMNRQLSAAAEAVDNKPMVTRSVSFSGPLCGSPALAATLKDSESWGHHLTINVDNSILARLLFDFQRLSSLTVSAEVETWRKIYETIYSFISEYLLTGELASSEDWIQRLCAAEDALADFETIHNTGCICPVGSFISISSAMSQESFTLVENDEIKKKLKDSCDLHYPAWRSVYTMREQRSPSHRSGLFNVVCFNGVPTPRIKHLSIQSIGRYGLSIRIEGDHLDTIMKRNLPAPLSFDKEDMAVGFPLLLTPAEAFDLSKAKLLAVRSSYREVIIDISGLKFSASSINFAVNTDFGCSKPTTFSTSSVSIVQEAPSSSSSQVLHPAMNGEFLEVALLRVALCSYHEGGLIPMAEQFPEICAVWEKLVDLEKICHFSDPILESQMDLFLSKQISIATLQGNCAKRLVRISEVATDSFQLEENMIKKGARKTLGGLSRVGGEILGLTGAIISLPALILSVPGILIANRLQSNPEPRGLSYRIGTGIYFGFVGIVALPSLIVSTVATGLRKASEYAMKDGQTFQYKQILNMLISLIGENSTEIVDEVVPLEDFFVTSFVTRFPGCDLSDCSHEDLVQTIQKAVNNGSISAAHFIDSIKRVPVILIKMLLVGRIRSIRRLLQRNLMLAFLGTKGSGTSTTLNRLFDVSMPVSDLIPTNPLPGLVHSQRAPHPYGLGKWLEDVASQSQHNDTLGDWFRRNDRDSLQVYAIDFPGINGEIGVGADDAVSFAGVASIFVLFFTYGILPTEDEKKLVAIAKAQHKPFLIIMNKSDTIESELKSPGHYETQIDHYASELDVPADIIHFMSSFDSYSNDKLRGILFGLLQNIVGDASANAALPLRFLPEHVLKELTKDESLDVLSSPGTLSNAVASLMFNLCPMTPGTVGDMFTILLSDRESSQTRPFSTPRANGPDSFNTISISTNDRIRQIAAGLKISDDTYNIFQVALSSRVLSSRDQYLKVLVSDIEAVSPDVKIRMENAMTLIALATLREQLNSYFGTPGSGSREDVESIARDVLLGIHQMVEVWVERGYQKNVVFTVIRDVLSSPTAISDSMILSLLLKVGPRFEAIKKHSGKEHKEELESYGALEFNKFSAAKDRLSQLSKVVLFQPFSEFSHLGFDNWEGAQDISVDKFRADVKEWTNKQSSKLLLTLTTSENVLSETFDKLMSMSKYEMENLNVTFQILSESAVDVNGVTRSVLSKITQEINSNPELSYLKRDEDSGLIYFDPSACCNSLHGDDSTERRDVSTTYRALGRLIGLCLIKSNIGATLPISFPITMYKLLLGYRIGMDDLSITSPQIVSSIRSISILDAETLESMELSFVTSGNDQKTYDLVINGSFKLVTEHNVMTYVTEVVRYYLCCQDRDKRGESNKSPLRQFLLGVQDFCPRDFFHALSPVTLQILLEGRREIDVNEWKSTSDIVGASLDSSTVSEFWEVVSELSDIDKTKLLCFGIGTTSLPLKGFKELDPKFRVIFGSPETEALPSSHTCFHMLMVPKYPSKEILKCKLLTAIRETDTAQLGIV